MHRSDVEAKERPHQPVMGPALHSLHSCSDCDIMDILPTHDNTGS